MSEQAQEQVLRYVWLTSEQGACLQDNALQMTWRFFHLGGKVAARGSHKEGFGFAVRVP